MPDISVNAVILLASCEAYRTNGFNDAARRTWIAQWGHLIDYRFVLGRGCKDPLPDEIVLDVEDSYAGLTKKVQAARKWATDNEFEHTLHAGADTYIVVPRFLKSEYEQRDYVGFLIHDEHRLVADRNIQFAQGGAGYCLSRRAGDIVTAATIEHDWQNKAEDVFVGDELFKAGIPFTHETGYWSWGYRAANDPSTLEGGPFIGMQSAVTIHLSRWWGAIKYTPAWMYDTHARVMQADPEKWLRVNNPAPPPDVL